MDSQHEQDQEIRHRLATDVLEGMDRWHTPSDRRRAKRYYFGTTDYVELEDSEVNAFLQWYTSDFRDAATGRTLVEHYLETHGAELRPRDRLLLEVWRDSWPGVFETEAVDEGRGIHLRDLTAGDTIFVHDVTASRQLYPGDCILSRIEKLDGKLMFVSDGSTVPPAVKGALLKLIDKEARAAGLTPVEYVRRSGNTLIRKIRRLSDQWLKNLRVVNREGEEIAFCSAAYRVLDAAALLTRLRSLPDLQEEPDDQGKVRFAWMDPEVENTRPVYGHVQVGGGLLRLEAQSRTRLQLGRGLLEAHAGRLLQHEGDQEVSLHEFKERMISGSLPEREERPPTERECEIMLQMKAQHYATWPDKPLPALGGKTARQAVRTKSGRRAVIDLIRDMERHENREAKSSQTAFDFGPLRKTLGVE
jgi:hypothetical protein